MRVIAATDRSGSIEKPNRPAAGTGVSDYRFTAVRNKSGVDIDVVKVIFRNRIVLDDTAIAVVEVNSSLAVVTNGVTGNGHVTGGPDFDSRIPVVANSIVGESIERRVDIHPRHFGAGGVITIAGNGVAGKSIVGAIRRDRDARSEVIGNGIAGEVTVSDIGGHRNPNVTIVFDGVIGEGHSGNVTVEVNSRGAVFDGEVFDGDIVAVADGNPVGGSAGGDGITIAIQSHSGTSDVDCFIDIFIKGAS